MSARKSWVWGASIVLLLVGSGESAARGATIEAGYAATYAAFELGTVPGLPDRYGGLTFMAGDTNTLLIGGLANTSSASVFKIGVTRDADGHITGFNGTAKFYASAIGSSGGGIDGGLAYGPGGMLFFTSFPDNRLGQIKPGATNTGKSVALTGLGYESSVGAMSFLPDWMPGYSADQIKLVSYSTGIWYTGTLSPDAGGYYDVSVASTPITLAGGPEGITYVKGGNPQFASNAILVSEFDNSAIVSYDVNANGDPIVASRKMFLSGLTGAFGAMIDPVTGDFLFSTFGEDNNKIVAVRGFSAPPPSVVPIPAAAGAGAVLMCLLALRRCRG